MFDDDPPSIHQPVLSGYGTDGQPQYDERGLRMVIDASMVRIELKKKRKKSKEGKKIIPQVGQLLGRRGRRVQEIRGQTCVRRIQILDAEESRREGAIRTERVILLLGNGDHCRHAHHLISLILEMDPAQLHASLVQSQQQRPYQQHEQQQQQVQRQHPSHPFSPPTAAWGFANGKKDDDSLLLLTSDATSSSIDCGARCQPNGPAVTAAGEPPSSSSSSSSVAGHDDELEFSSEVIVRISNDNIGRLIGKQGSIIQRIRQVCLYYICFFSSLHLLNKRTSAYL